MSRLSMAGAADHQQLQVERRGTEMYDEISARSSLSRRQTLGGHAEIEIQETLNFEVGLKVSGRTETAHSIPSSA